IDAAQEEARDRGYALERPAGCGPALECPDIGFGDRFVVRDRKEQRDVDVDPLEEELLDGRDGGCGAWYLDEEIGPVHPLPKPPRLLHRPFTVVREMRGDF